MKICDVADWFRPEFSSVVMNELHEVPRFHRKQWEFASILMALSDAGVLHPDAVGISFGAARELPIYAIANKVRKIWATDLYTENTSWPIARVTESDDVTEFVRAGAVFPTRKDRIEARSMDMRSIDFPDLSFDFAYSGSAVEHIGGWPDFATHLAEVRRVLKPGGVYVLTTDISFLGGTEGMGNFKFSPEQLGWWLKTSDMAYEPRIDCRVAHHYGNMPMPDDLSSYMMPGSGLMNTNFFGTILMAHNLHFGNPHTSVMLVMKKAPPSPQPVELLGFDETKKFLMDCRTWVAMLLEGSTLRPDPAPWLPANLRSEQWASTYLWLGNGRRIARVKVAVKHPCTVAVGVNRAHRSSYWISQAEVPEAHHHVDTEAEFELPINCNEEFGYSLFGRTLSPHALRDVSLMVSGNIAIGSASQSGSGHADRTTAGPGSPALPRPGVKRAIKAVLLKAPYIGPILQDRDRMYAELRMLRGVWPPS